MSELRMCTVCGELAVLEHGLCVLCEQTGHVAPKANRAEELAEAHWGYIKELLVQHSASSGTIETVGFHYKTAFVHGYKHAMEE